MNRQDGGILVVLLALVFIAAGLAAGFLLLREVPLLIDARGWVQVPARVLEVDLIEQRDDDGANWDVYVRYEYEWRGRAYQAERVDFHPGADNFGQYQKQMHDRLEQARRRGDSIVVWVDPDAPDRAVIRRAPRWGALAFALLFPVVFCSAGAGLLWMLRRGGRRAAARAALRDAEPERPWLWSGRWRSTTLNSDTGATAWVATGFALFWNLVSLPLLFLVPREIDKGNWAALLGLLFPLIGIGLIIWAVRAWIRRRRYGVSTLELEALPVPLGGTLRARLNIPARLQGRELAVQALCVHRYRTGSGKNRRTTERVLWEDRVMVPLHSGAGPGQTAARIEMHLPGDRPQASDENPDDQIVWRLEVASEEPGVDYKAVFELPVFDVGPTVDDDQPRAATQARPVFEADDWRETGVEHGYAPGGQRFFFPRLRLAGAGLGALVFALVFLGTAAFMLIGPGLWFFGVVFGLVGLLIAWAAVTMLFSRSEIVIGGDRLRWRHGVFGGWHEVESGAIKAIDIKRSGGIGQDLYFRIEVERWGESGKTTIADWVRNERASRSLATHLADLAGVRSESEPE